jgi:peptidoglycan hydrolase CwlO-like protein
MLASATLLKPHRVRKQANTEEGKKLAKSTYEQQTGLKDRLRSMLENEELIPRVRLIILSSNLTNFIS